MRYILYVGSYTQIQKIVSHSEFLHLAKKHKDGFIISQPSLLNEKLQIDFVDSLERVSFHLRKFPVDLLVYDERDAHKSALEAVEMIHQDVLALSNAWGADFLFPMGRCLVILNKSENASQVTFLLGRHHIRDVIVNPLSISRVIRWIGYLLLRDKNQEKKVALAMSGGGLEGFLFQMGTLVALEKALTRGSLYHCDVYSGVSSGSLCASMMAAGVPMEEVILSFYGQSQILPDFTARKIYDVAYSHIGKRLMPENLSPLKWLQKIFQIVPTGFFQGENLKQYVATALEAFGCPQTFSELKNQLFIGATHQDTFEHVVFGVSPWTDLTIVDAIRASCALPPFFTPHILKGQPFIDGQITRSINLEHVMKEQCKLVMIIDPMKPFSTLEPGYVEKEGGIYTLIQAIKGLVYSRFHDSLSHMTERFPDVDFLVFQPYGPTAQMMAGSPMKLTIQTAIVELAYRGTLQRLRERHHVYSAKLEKFGFKLASIKKLAEMEQSFL